MNADFLPDNLLRLLHDHVLDPHAPIHALKRSAAAHAGRAARAMYPAVEPLLDRVTRALYSSPDIVVLAFVVVVLVLFLQAVVWLKRIVSFLTRLAFRVLFWACLVGLAAVVWRRGAEATLRDVVVIGGKMAGYAAVVKDIWVREYQRYEAQAQGRPPPRARGGRSRGR